MRQVWRVDILGLEDYDSDIDGQTEVADLHRLAPLSGRWICASGGKDAWAVGSSSQPTDLVGFRADRGCRRCAGVGEPADRRAFDALDLLN